MSLPTSQLAVRGTTATNAPEIPPVDAQVDGVAQTKVSAAESPRKEKTKEDMDVTEKKEDIVEVTPADGLKVVILEEGPVQEKGTR